MSFRNKWFRWVFQRRALICVLIILQAAFMIWLVASGSKLSARLGRVLAVLYIVSYRNKGSCKMA